MTLQNVVGGEELSPEAPSANLATSLAYNSDPEVQLEPSAIVDTLPLSDSGYMLESSPVNPVGGTDAATMIKER